MRKLVFAAIAAPVILSGSASFAAELNKGTSTFRSGTVSFDVGLGVVSGEANEYVFDEDGDKASQLIWKYDNNMMLKGGVEWTPLHGLALGARGSINITDNATMDDWDWIYVLADDNCNNYTLCHSHHDGTYLDRKTSADVYLAKTLLERNGYAFAGLVGYKWDYSKWKAFGGISNYGDLPNGLGITYSQTWDTPYLGVQLQHAVGPWSFMGRAIGSWAASGKADDTHHHRDLHFIDEFDSTRMLGATAQVAYQAVVGAIVSFQYDFQKYGRAVGPTNIPVASMGGNFVSGISEPEAGADNTSHSVSLGLSYAF